MLAVPCKPNSEALTKVLETPSRPLAAIVGGAKESPPSFLTVLRQSFGPGGTSSIIGGREWRNTCFWPHWVIMSGRSLCEYDLLSTAREIVAHAEAKGREIVLPVDAVVAQKLEANVPSRVVSVNAIGAFDMIL